MLSSGFGGALGCANAAATLPVVCGARKPTIMAYLDSPETQRANRRFIRHAMKVDLLPQEREFELARRWREGDDESALHELVTAYIRLVVSIATRFRAYGLPLGDMVQEGSVGLMQAAARFEPKRKVRFSTYASWWIRSTIQEYILRNWSIVRTGTTAAQKSLFFNLRRLRARIDGANASRLSECAIKEIARVLRVTEPEVEAMEARLAGADKSLNDAFGEAGEGEVQDMIADESSTPEETTLELRESEVRALWLAAGLSELTQREQTIIRERRLRDKGVTLAALGRRFGISKERVRQIEYEALGKLRAAIVRQVGDPAAVGLVP